MADGKEPRKRKVRDLVSNKASIVTGSPQDVGKNNIQFDFKEELRLRACYIWKEDEKKREPILCRNDESY